MACCRGPDSAGIPPGFRGYGENLLLVSGVAVIPFMMVAIEFYGIARARAGVAETVASGACLGDVLEDLSRRFPRLAETCIDGRSLRSGFTASINGRRFVTSPETPVFPNDVVLLLSVDAGG